MHISKCRQPWLIIDCISSGVANGERMEGECFKKRTFLSNGPLSLCNILMMKRGNKESRRRSVCLCVWRCVRGAGGKIRRDGEHEKVMRSSEVQERRCAAPEASSDSVCM